MPSHDDRLHGGAAANGAGIGAPANLGPPRGARLERDVIVRLLANIGSRKEVEQYLRHYASVDAPKFAVVKVSGAVIDGSLDALASSMSFLQRVGLVPIVV